MEFWIEVVFRLKDIGFNFSYLFIEFKFLYFLLLCNEEYVIGCNNCYKLWCLNNFVVCVRGMLDNLL